MGHYDTESGDLNKHASMNTVYICEVRATSKPNESKVSDAPHQYEMDLTTIHIMCSIYAQCIIYVYHL